MQDRCERCVRGCILVQASGRSWLPRTVVSTGRGATQSSLCCAEGLRGVAALLLTAEGCALAALCAGASWHDCAVCAAGCAGLAAGVCGKMEGQLLLLLPG